MTPTEKDVLNRELAKELGIPIGIEHFPYCYPDFAADPRLVLREIDRLKKRESFINYLLRTENTWSILDMAFDFMIDTTGIFRDKAIEFMKETTEQDLLEDAS